MTLGSLRGPLLAGMVALQGCAEYRVSVPDSDPIQLEGQEGEYVARTMDAYFWGNILDPQVVAADCQVRRMYGSERVDQWQASRSALLGSPEVARIFANPFVTRLQLA